MYPRGRYTSSFLRVRLVLLPPDFPRRRLEIRNFLYELTCPLPFMVTFNPSDALSKLSRRDRCKLFYRSRVPFPYFTPVFRIPNLSRRVSAYKMKQTCSQLTKIMYSTVLYRSLRYRTRRTLHHATEARSYKLNKTERA